MHDAGTFDISIDDRGLWGFRRSEIGLQVNGIEQLFQGSILLSYSDEIVATATFHQKDFETTDDGYLIFNEPGASSSEEAIVVYQDVSTFHPNSLRVIQKSKMWKDESFYL